MDRGNQAEVTADILSEFVEVVIHSVLYCRGIYPQGVFVRKRKYNIPVQVCLHPDVRQYVSGVCSCLRTLLLQGAVRRVDIVLTSPLSHPLERFVLDIGQVSSDVSVKDDQFLLRLEQSLRALLLKLNVSDSLLQPLPSACSWTVHVHTKESAAADLEDQMVNRDFPWVEAEESEQQLKDAQLVPLKSLNSHLFKIQLYAEESREKT
ncbi:mitotic spindle assembly checkpoint protein MAD2B-like isoform X2 [Babylonia areolata]|uniref:mitotic spindle assembly checkpoint protein MAD2B-like isoform X2 n=1 Tax=Babylonia areolata TaxID=304850 RepID=UPI003FD2F5DE